MERSTEDLVARSKLALADPELANIAQSALSANGAYNQARDLLKDRKGLRFLNEISQKDLELAKSCRFAWMLRKKSKQEFENYARLLGERTTVIQKPEEKGMREKKKIYNISIPSGETTKVSVEGSEFRGFSVEVESGDVWNIFYLCDQLLDIISDLEVSDFPKAKGLPKIVRDQMIKLLEEKFGLDPFIEVLEKRGIKVKICGFCKYCEKSSHYVCTKSYSPGIVIDVMGSRKCWEPKEVKKKTIEDNNT